MGPDYIGPAVDHFQEITAQYPQVREPRPAPGGPACGTSAATVLSDLLVDVVTMTTSDLRANSALSRMEQSL